MKIVFLTVTLGILVTLIPIFITKLNNWVEENPVWTILISASIGSPVVVTMVVWKKLDKIILRIWPITRYSKKEKYFESELKQLNNELNEIQEKIDEKRGALV